MTFQQTEARRGPFQRSVCSIRAYMLKCAKLCICAPKKCPSGRSDCKPKRHIFSLPSSSIELCSLKCEGTHFIQQ